MTAHRNKLTEAAEALRAREPHRVAFLIKRLGLSDIRFAFLSDPGVLDDALALLRAAAEPEAKANRAVPDDYATCPCCGNVEPIV
jgi:hypothetical protein